MRNSRTKPTIRRIFRSAWTGLSPWITQTAPGRITAGKCFSCISGISIPPLDLLFDSQEEAQNFIDDTKKAVVGPGDTIVAERSSFTPQPQAAMTVIDQKTGYVKGIVGGRGVKTASLTLNRATDTCDQPGSTFKILSTYGPALDNRRHYAGHSYSGRAL